MAQDELAKKLMHKLERRNLVQPGTLRVVIDIDLNKGVQTHAITENSGHAAKELIDGVYVLLAKYQAAPPSTVKPSRAEPNAAKKPATAGGNSKKG